ncbi:MAG: glutamate racemase [Patescibacteria group bacterium]
MIGVFDSGFGGLTILKELLRQLPDYNYIYLGDNARTPYGNKSDEVIYNYSRQAVDFLFKQGCELIIIACNTASAKALREIQQAWLPKHYLEKRVLGVIIPVVEETAALVKKKATKNKIGLIGTKATIKSKAYEKELKKFNNLDFKIYPKPAPLLVPLVEEGWTKRRETKMILRYYLRPLKEKRINYLILGCTHYPILLKQIKEIMGNQCQVVDSPKIVADKLKNYLMRHPEIENKINQSRQRTYYTTDDPTKFKEMASRFLGEKVEQVKKIEL